MENTPQNKSELSAQATAVAAECKQLEQQFEMLQTMQKNLQTIANLKVRNQKMIDEIAKQISDLKIGAPK